MFGRFASNMGFVGVDFSTRGIKMLQVCERNGELEVVGAARVDSPLTHVNLPSKSNDKPISGYAPDAAAPSVIAGATANALSESIRSAFAAGGFTGRRCVIGLAREDVFVQSVRLPKMPDEELRQTVQWEAAQRFGFDRSAMQVDFIRTGATLASGENRDEVILIAAPHAAIHARLEPIMAAGLRPVAVDTGFTSLVPTFSRRVRREADQSIVRAVVDIGASGSTILILRGDQVAFCKPLAISGEQFNRAVAEHLQMSERDAAELRQVRIASAIGTQTVSVTNQEPLEFTPNTSTTDPDTDRAVYSAVRPVIGELAKEITLCLRYYGVTFRGHPPERIILTGGESLEPKLDETIAKTCKLHVAFDDAPAALTGLIGQIQSCLNRTAGPFSCWAAAMGLSMRGLNTRNSRRESGAVQEMAKGAA